MGLFVQPVMTNLKLAFASDVVGIRRMVVMVLVEFKVKIPQEFNQYVPRVHPTHQRLIDLYKSRRAPRFCSDVFGPLEGRGAESKPSKCSRCTFLIH
jgi:hypothetical protein